MEEVYSESESSQDENYTLRRRVRRGSEGYEVKHMSRDDMLRPYLPSEAAASNFGLPAKAEDSESDEEQASNTYDGGSVV